jgi:hypothetical protein
MDEKIDPGLFARLMRLSPGTRKDLLEYLGQGPVSSRGMLDPLQRLPVPRELPPQPGAPDR